MCNDFRLGASSIQLAIAPGNGPLTLTDVTHSNDSLNHGFILEFQSPE